MSAAQINVARIIEEMKRHGWGVAATAVNVGVNNKTLKKILDGEMPKRLDAFYRLIDGLKIPIEEALYGSPFKARPGSPFWYIADGKILRSTKTDKKTLAEHRLTEYIRGTYGLKPTPAVQEYYDKWLQTKVEPLFRRAQVRDYRQHFKAYILPRFKHIRLLAVGYGDLTDFRVELLRKDLAVKTVRNIIDGSFRAMYRDARAEYDELKGRDPFIDLQWPASQRKKPEAFTSSERDRIVQHYVKNNFFYFPWVFVLFHTGMRPSEAAGLTWHDVDLEAITISISKSRYMGTDSAPKTSKSARVIKINNAVADVLKLLPSRELGIKHVFVNKLGEPMNSKKWAEHNWAEPLKKLGIDHKKFYCTRHTFITAMIQRGENPMAVPNIAGPQCR